MGPLHWPGTSATWLTVIKLRDGAHQGRQGTEKVELDALTHGRQNDRLSCLVATWDLDLLSYIWRMNPPLDKAEPSFLPVEKLNMPGTLSARLPCGYNLSPVGQTPLRVQGQLRPDSVEVVWQLWVKLVLVSMPGSGGSSLPHSSGGFPASVAGCPAPSLVPFLPEVVDT